MACMDPRGTVGRIYKRTLIPCYIQNMNVLGLVTFPRFFAFLILSLWELMTSEAARCIRLAGFIKRNTIHCYIQNMKALGLVVSEKIIFMFFPSGMVGRIYKEDHHTLCHRAK